VNVQSFLEAIGKNPPPPVVLLCPGKANPKSNKVTFEPYLAEEVIARLVDAVVDPSVRDLAYTVFHGDETKAQEIVQEARTVPFLAERRVVLVRNADRFGADSGEEALLEYLEAPCDMTSLLMVAGQVDRRTRFYKLCEKAGLIVECPMLSQREASAWAVNEARKRGKKLALAAAEQMVHRSGLHLGDINNALNIVVSFVGDRETIGESDVTAACADVAEEEIWTLTDAIAASEMPKALESLRRLQDLGKHEDEILGSINWLLTSAYAVESSGSHATVHAFVADKVRPLGKKFGLKKLRAAFQLCTDTHFMIRSTGVNGPLALELLVLKLAMPYPKPTRP